MQRLVHGSTGSDLAQSKAGLGAFVPGTSELQCRSREHHKGPAELRRQALLEGYQPLSRPDHWPAPQGNNNICDPDPEMVQGDKRC